MLKRNKKQNSADKANEAQAILEFTFCMIIVLLMIYGVAKVFIWTGKDVAERRIAHDNRLINNTISPQEQIEPDFYIPVKMNAVWDGN